MNRTSSRTGLFLMELILAVLFFSLAGAVCVRLFVNSHLISEKSVELNHGVLYCQNVAECFYACEGDLAKMASFFPEGTLEVAEDEKNILKLSFNEDFSPVEASTEASASSPGDGSASEDTVCYQLEASVTSETKQLLTCHITIVKTADDTIVYELSPTLFTGKETAHE